MGRIKTLVFVGIAFFIAGCSCISHDYLLVPKEGSGYEVFKPKRVPGQYHFINTGPAYFAKIQYPEVNLRIFVSPTDDFPLASGPLIFPVIPVFLLHPITHHTGMDYSMYIGVALSNASSLNWDISKCIVTLPNGQKITPTGYLSSKTGMLTSIHDELKTEGRNQSPLEVDIRYPVSVRDLDSFTLFLDGLTVGTENILVPQIQFQKDSALFWTIINIGGGWESMDEESNVSDMQKEQ